MNTSSLFLRYYEIDSLGEQVDGSEKFVSISDIDYSGAPIDDDGEILDNDNYVYYLAQNGEYKIILPPIDKM